MKLKLSIVLISTVGIYVLFPSVVEARSGCCSHHGGVCGCGCCDGTLLSTTCASYYPKCDSSSIRPTIKPPSKFSPTVRPSSGLYSPKPTPIVQPAILPTLIPIKKNSLPKPNSPKKETTSNIPLFDLVFKWFSKTK